MIKQSYIPAALPVNNLNYHLLLHLVKLANSVRACFQMFILFVESVFGFRLSKCACRVCRLRNERLPSFVPQPVALIYSCFMR